MKATRTLARLGCLAMFFVAVTVHAHEGHDDAPSAPPNVAGAPRVEAASDLFEVVGIVERDTMTVFLDRFATNEPLVNAKIGIEAGTTKGTAQANPDGTYTFAHSALAKPGSIPVTFTVAAGTETDLLTGELVIADPNAADTRLQPTTKWTEVVWIAGALVLVGTVAMLWWFRRRQISPKGIQ